MPNMSGIARALDGRVILRIEDHDRGRSRTEYETAILDDLDWLGYRADRCTTDEYRAGFCPGRQSGRDDAGTWPPSRRSRTADSSMDASVRGGPWRRPQVRRRSTMPAAVARRTLRPRRGRVAPADGPRSRDFRRRTARAAGTGSCCAVRRPPASRSQRQLDLPVRRDGRRLASGGRPCDSRDGSPAVDRSADSTGASARTRADTPPTSITR